MSTLYDKLKKSLALLLTAVLVLTSFCPAASAAASPAIDFSRKGTVRIDLHYQETPLAGGVFDLYRVAEIDSASPTLSYRLIGPFAPANVDLNALGSNEDVARAVALLTPYVPTDVQPDARVTTGADGKADTGEILELGLYLVIQRSGPAYYSLSPSFLAGLPATNEAGTAWEYTLNVTPKVSYTYDPPPGGGDETISVSVTKRWDDEGFEDERPASIQVGLYANGALRQRYTLNEGNGWSHTWSNLSLNSSWSVDELDPPEGYVSMVVSEGAGYTITNSKERVPLAGVITASKIWADDNDRAGARPGSITVTLSRDGVPYDTVELNPANGWSWVWPGLTMGSGWTIAESGVPAGYTSSVSRVDNGFVITNTYGSGGGPGSDPGSDPGSNPGSDPGTPGADIPDGDVPTGDLDLDIGDDDIPLGDAPQTGMVQWPIPILLCAGLVLLCLGLIPERKKRA